MNFFLKSCLFLISIAVLDGCTYSGCEEVRLGGEELTWFDSYEMGDTIIMSSNLNNFDTLVVYEKTKEISHCNKFEQGNNVYESFSISLKSLVNGETCLLKADMNEFSDCYLQIWFYNLVYCSESRDDFIKAKKNMISGFHNSQKQLFKFDKRNSRHTHNFNVSSFTWIPREGIVEYETMDGELYRRVK